MVVHLEYDEPVLGYHRIVARLVGDLAPSRATVADLGCGPGQILGCLADLRPDLTLIGVDGDPECLRRAAERCPTAELKQDDIAAVGSLQDQSVDVIASSHSLEHLPAPVETLHRWADLLRPGGHLVVAVPNALQPPLLARALLRRDWVNEGHYYIWDRATLLNFCKLAGFTVVDSAVDYVPLVPVRHRRRVPLIENVERRLAGLFPRLANSHIVVLRRP
jgi:SAM-dependent methyltransferase